MDVRLSLSPTDVNRFRRQTVLRAYVQGRPRTRIERGLTGGGEEALPYRLIRSTFALTGESWSADMSISHGEVGSAPFCFVDIRPASGPAAPLCALLQALAGGVHFSVSALDLPLLVPGRLPASVKARPPPLAAGMSAAEAFGQIAAGAFAHLVANHDCLTGGDQAEAIHQMRVALRRLGSAMSMFKAMLDGPETEMLRAELRWLRRVLGAARDWDVLLADTVAPMRETLGGLAGYERLCTMIAERRQQARCAALSELATPRLPRLMLRLAFWIETAGHAHPLAARPVADVARLILDKRHRRVRHGMRRFLDLSVEGRHQSRIDIKKLRYAVDFFASLYPVKRGQRLPPLLAALQDRLGALNDVAVARETLKALVLRDGSAELAWAAGQLIGWHAGRSEALIEKIQQDWTEIEKIPAFWRET